MVFKCIKSLLTLQEEKHRRVTEEMKFEWQLEVTKWQSEKDILVQKLTKSQKDYGQLVRIPSVFTHTYTRLHKCALSPQYV